MADATDPDAAVTAQIVRRTDDELTLLVDENVYAREAVLRACYWFTDRCYLFVSRVDVGRFSVSIRPKSPDIALQAIAGEFSNALIDYQVRLDIERETHQIRELIVAKAFAEGNLLEDLPVGDDRDPVEVERSTESKKATLR